MLGGTSLDRIAILGMGPIGISIGLGLKRVELKETEIVGVDGDRTALSKASKLGAFDRTTADLRSAVKGAQLVVLDTAGTTNHEVIEVIGPALDRGCVVTDTSGAKTHAIALAEAHLGAGTGFVGGHPLTRRPLDSVESADASIFEGIDYCVIPAASADVEAVGTVVGMVETLGARPFFMDASEHDSFDAAVTQLPALLSRALVNATTSSKSWREMSRLAGSEFGQVALLASDDPKDSAADCLGNREALAHWVDQVIAVLYSYRNDIKSGSDDLGVSFVRAWEEWTRWNEGTVEERKRADIPSAGETIASMFFGKRLVERQRQIRKAGNRAPWEYPGRKR